MKKFTSLFALLSCLCVVSAQAASVTIYVNPSDPNSQRIYWWGGKLDDGSENGAWYSFDDSRLIKDLGEQYGIFRKLVFTPDDNNSSINIILHQGSGNQTNTLTLSGSNNYYYYYGGDNYTYKNSYDIKIAGTFTEWASTSITNEGDGKWSYEFSASSQAQFKFKQHDFYWLGYDHFLSQNPYTGFLFRYDGGESDNNIILEPLPGINTYKVTVDLNGGLSMKIEGKYLDLDDEIEFNTSANLDNFKVCYAQYYRTCANQWGTLCLPFGFDTQDQQGATFYNFTSISGQALNLTPITGTVEAGTPIVFKVNDNLDEKSILIRGSEYTEVFENPSVTLRNTPNNTQFGNSYSSFGTFKNQSIESGLYFIKDDQFWYGSQGADFKPYRAWFTGPAPQSPAPFRISVDDTEGLQFVEQEDGTVKAYFDLQGRKLDGARKGLVIENGKIIMVK